MILRVLQAVRVSDHHRCPGRHEAGLRMHKIVILASLGAALMQAQIGLIVDDDCSTDYCPAPTQFKLMDLGEAKVLAVIADSSADYAAPVMRINAEYYHYAVPVYANQQDTPNNLNCTSKACNGPNTAGQERWLGFRPGDTKANYTDCVTG